MKKPIKEKIDDACIFELYKMVKKIERRVKKLEAFNSTKRRIKK